MTCGVSDWRVEDFLGLWHLGFQIDMISTVGGGNPSPRLSPEFLGASVVQGP